MSEANKTSIILKEHKNIVFARYLLTLLGFIVILAGSLTTLFLIQRKGSPDYFLIAVYVIIGINALQICVCVLDFMLRIFAGIYARVMSILAYVAGAGWVIAILVAMALCYVDEGFLRTDLMIIAVIQLIVSLIVYIIIPVLERKSLNAFVRQEVRISPEKRKSTSQAYIRAYAIMAVCIIACQVLALLAYKAPPKVYDIFSDTRALKYELNEDGSAYIVTGVYNGTSTQVNIPSEYNNKPVIGIASGAFTDDEIFTINKIDSITFGIQKKSDDGTEKIVSELRYIESGAIVNNQITALELPESVESIGKGAVSGSALTTIKYSSKAAFSANCFDAASLETIILSGENVGRIDSLEGLNTDVSVQVDKNIYNKYRKENPEYAKNFSPILEESEFCIDFFTDSDYYIESIIAKTGTEVTLGYEDLVGENNTGTPISVDTLAYIKNNREVATDGAKDGYAFRGWYYDSDFLRECKFSESEKLTFTRSTSLYAKWAEEYTVELDWGTYVPESAAERLYWAEGETIELPKAESIRDGFDAGVKWFDDDEEIATTEDISEDLSLSAKWQLDFPEARIATEFTDDNYDSGDQGIRFTYDEERILTLKAISTHDASVNFLYRWERDGELEAETGSIKVQNVPETGLYTLTVIAVAPTGERSEATDLLKVEISKKALEKGNSSVSEKYNREYNGSRQSIDALDIPDDIVVNLVFKKEDGEVLSEGAMGAQGVGVIFAGEYKLTAEYKKKSVKDVKNYETVTEEAEFIIIPKYLTSFNWRGSWQTEGSETNSEVEYTGKAHYVFMTYDGVVSDDEIKPMYKTTGSDNSVCKNAGTYTTTLTGIGNTNYSIDECTRLSHEWKIVPKTLDVESWTLDGDGKDSVTYDSAKHKVSATVTGVVSEDTGKIVFTYSGDGEAINAGSYEASITGVNSDNYKLNSEDNDRIFKWNIKKRELSASFSGTDDLIYNGESQRVSLNITNIAGTDYEYFDKTSFNNPSGADEISISKDMDGNFNIRFDITDAGNYTLSVGEGLTNINETLNNYEFRGISQEVSIAKKPLSEPQIETEYVYDGTLQTLELVYSGFYNSDAKNVSFKGMSGTFSDDGKRFTLTTTGKNAGKYTLSVMAANFESKNYSISDYNAEFTIEERQLVLNDYGYNSISLSKQTYFTYNGVVAKAYAVFGNVAAADASEKNIRIEFDNENGEIKNAGTYSLSLTLNLLQTQLGENISNYEFAGQTYSFTIEPKSVTPSWNFEAVYTGNADNEFVYTGDEIAAPTASFGNQICDGDTITIEYSGNEAKTDVGIYTTSISSLGNDNYKLNNNAEYEWKIIHKQLTLKWNAVQPYVYDGNNNGQSLTVEGILGDDEVGLKVVGTGSYSTEIRVKKEDNKRTIAPFSNAGSYSLKVDSVVSGNYSLPQDNLEISYEIQKAELTLSGWTWSNEKDFTGDNTKEGFESLVYRYSTYKLQNEISDDLGKSKDVILNYEENEKTNVGDYTAKITGLSGDDADNFKLPDEGLTKEWKIIPKVIDVKWTGGNQFTFNAETISVEASCSTGAESDKDGLTYDDGVSLKYSGNSYRNAGEYTANASVDDPSGNYTLNTDTTSHNWSISVCELGAPVWDKKTFTYNGTSLYPTAKFNIHGDVDVTVAYEYISSNAVDVGEKKIKVTGIGGEDAANYTLSDEAKTEYTYEITPLAVKIEWYYIKDGGNKASIDNLTDYDGKAATISAEVKNVIGTDVFSFTYEGDTNVTNAGSYSIKLTALGNDNYTTDGGENIALNFEIRKRTLEFEWENSGDKVYVASGYTLSATASNLADGDAVSSITYNRENSFTAVGTYPVSIANVTFSDSSDANNYELDNAIGRSETITIVPRPVSIEWTNTEAEYDGKAHKPTVTVKGTDSVMIGTDEYTVTGPEAINAGSYEFELTLVRTNSNYTLTDATGNTKCTLNISRCSVAAVWWNDAESSSFTGNITDNGYDVAVKVGNLDLSAYTVLYKKEGEEQFLELVDGNALSEAGVYELKIKLNDNYAHNYNLSNATVMLTLITSAESEVTDEE